MMAMKRLASQVIESSSDSEEDSSSESADSDIPMKKNKTMPVNVSKKGALVSKEKESKSEKSKKEPVESKEEAKKVQKFSTDLEFYTLETRARVAVQEAIKPVVKD